MTYSKKNFTTALYTSLNKQSSPNHSLSYPKNPQYIITNKKTQKHLSNDQNNIDKNNLVYGKVLHRNNNSKVITIAHQIQRDPD